MFKKILFAFASILLFSCSNTENQEILVYANGEQVKTSEKEELFNLKKMNPNTKEIPFDIHIKEQAFVSKIASATNSIEWFSRGPNNLGGRTRALALDRENSNRILIGGVSGGIYISEDLGQNFVKAITPQQFHSITCIAQDPRPGFDNIWYYGTGEQNGNSSDLIGNGIYKSTDSGLTWSTLTSTANDVSTAISPLGDFRYVKDIKVSSIDGSIVAACFSGIWTSQDFGSSWTNVLVGGADPNGFGYINFGKQTNIDVSETGIFYATLSRDCTDEGIWRSTDGLIWTNITPPGIANSYRRIESGISPLDENQVFFIADVSTTVPLGDNHELWKYNHNSSGGFWTDKTANIPAGTCTGFFDFDFGFFQSQNSYDLYITVHPSDTNLIFLGGTNLYRSTDGFSTPAHDWIGGYYCDAANPSNYVHPNHHPDNHVGIFVPNTDIMLSAHDGGLSITQNCKVNEVIWEYTNNGYKTSQFYTVCIEPGDVENDIIMGGLQDNGTWVTNSENPNQEWMQSFIGDGAYCAITEGRDNYYMSWQVGKLYKTTVDDDGNLLTYERIDPSGASNYLFINPFILDPSNDNTMYMAGGQYIWRNDSLSDIPVTNNAFTSNDFGWGRISESNVQGITIPGAAVPRISTLDMSENNTDVIYYGTTASTLFKLTGLDTKTYVKTNIKGNNMPSGYTSSVEVDNNDENKVMVTFSNYEIESVFFSEDAGANWDDVSGNLEQFENGSGAGPSVNWAHIYFDGTKNIYFVGTTSGLFSTEILDGTNTIWLREGLETIGNVPIHMITSRDFDKNLVVATHGNGVFSNKEFISGIEDLELEKNGMYLSNVSPNPVKNKMKFTYRIDEGAFVSLKIYNVAGQLIDIVQEGNKEAGTYEMRWFAKKELSKGLYQLVLDINGKKLNKKFLVK